MVGILSSLNTSREPKTAEARTARIPPRPNTPLDFPRLPRPERSGADLARVIEGEIIPRLMLAHSPSETGAPPQPAAAVPPRMLETFAQMTLSSEAHTLKSYVEALIQRGLSLDQVYIDLLIPTARRLGDDWNEDVISFTDVTIGLSRLQQVVRALGRSLPTREPADDAPSAYFMPSPCEQHAFGLVIVEDHFRRAGWRTRLDTAATREEAARTLRQEWFDVFGLSATSDTPTAVIASVIAQVRQASANPEIFVMVGGRLFLEDLSLAAAVGADAASASAGDALLIAGKAIRPVVSA